MSIASVRGPADRRRAPCPPLDGAASTATRGRPSASALAPTPFRALKQVSGLTDIAAALVLKVDDRVRRVCDGLVRTQQPCPALQAEMREHWPHLSLTIEHTQAVPLRPSMRHFAPARYLAPSLGRATPSQPGHHLHAGRLLLEAAHRLRGGQGPGRAVD